MGDNSGNLPRKRKWKKKKSVLLNARKYLKKGCYGRGNEVSEDTYQYFLRILETFKDGFSEEEEKILFANNVLNQTENEEINYSGNQVGCRVIELLLPFSNIENLKRFINVFDDNLRQYTSHRFVSHVLQTLLRVCCEKSLTETDEEIKEVCKNFTLKLSKFLMNNLEDYINDTYANHVVREVFYTLAQIPKEDKTKKHDEQKIKEETNVNIPEEYTEIIQEYAKRLILWPHFKDFPFNELSSGLLQVLLVALKKINMKLLKKIVKKLLDESFSVISEPEHENDNIKDVFKSKPATILLEVAISIATPKLFTQIYANCFVQNLAMLAKNKDTNFAVQKLLEFCTEKVEFEAMFEELSDHFEEIISCGCTGVISAIAQTCKRLIVKQGHFVQSLMKALHCMDPQERHNSFVPTVVRFIPYERIDAAQKEKYFVNLHGSLTLQAMLEFNKPIKIVNSILNMEPNDLKNIFCDTKGSYVIDSFIKSPYIGEKSREKLIWRLLGTYQELAVSKNGSRSLEAIYKVANLKLRMKIMDELSYKEGLWSNTASGKIVAYNFNLKLYMRNKEEWKQSLGKTEKTKELFADIIEEKF